MKKLCFIIPYFGKFNNYYPLFLKTCEWNKDFNWLVFTDDKTEYNYPNNVKRIEIQFSECQDLVKSKFNTAVSLVHPYKLCDLKPMYGYIFEEHIKEYQFWGHCDVDTLMGNLNRWLTDDILEYYDKLFQLGHMTIYKNTYENNRLFMHEHRGHFPYKLVLANPKNCWFDEEWNNLSNINRIFIDNGKRILKEDFSLNISLSYNRFVRGKFVGPENTDMPYGFEIEKPKDALYIWKNGELYRLYKKNGELVREDFLYLHLQKRKMYLHKNVLNSNYFKIVPDEFLPIDYSDIDYTNFDRIKKIGRCWHKQRMFKERVMRKLKKVFSKI